MAEPILDTPARIRTSHRCRGCRRELLLVAACHAAGDGRRWVRYFLIEPAGRKTAGEQVSTCPHCGHPLPRLSWSEFEDRMPEAHGA